MGSEKKDDEKKGGCNLEICHPEYPRRVFFIISNEFCERFCYYGMKAILQSYLISKLRLDVDTAATLYHTFAMVTYFMPLPGAILADSFIGRYWTILSLSVVYVVGNVVMALSAVDQGSLEAALIGMFTIAVGTGGIKPCVSSFGADQFSADQTNFQKSFFSMFYMAINGGALLSQFITPIIKSTPCFGEEQCWVLAFGVPGALMCVALLLFLLGTPFYKRAPVTENIVAKVGRAVWLGWKRSGCCSGNALPVEHWLDRAVPEFTQEFVNECKAVFRVLLLFIPLPFFWALFDQQGSRWTLQAQKMNTYIDFLDIHLEPEQVQIMNGLMVLCFVAVFDAVVYPVFAKCNIFVKPLQRIIGGCFLAGVAFIAIAIIQFDVNENDSLKEFNQNTYRTRVYNLHDNCELDMIRQGYQDKEPSNEKITLKTHETFLYGPDRAQSGTKLHFSIICPDSVTTRTVVIETNSSTPITHLVFGPGDRDFHWIGSTTSFPYNKYNERSPEWLYEIMVSIFTPLSDKDIKDMWIVKDDTVYIGPYKPSSNGLMTIEYKTKSQPSQYFKFKYADTKGNTIVFDKNLYFLQGGAYVIFAYRNATGQMHVDMLIDKGANLVSAYWQAIPYLIITWAEILFSITGLSFAFSQAPASMKSLLTACWLLTSSFGNVIDLIIIQIQMEDKANEFFLFAGLMFAVTIIFSIQAYFYVYVEEVEKKEDELEKTDPEHHPHHPHMEHVRPIVTSPTMPYLTMPAPSYDAEKQQPVVIHNNNIAVVFPAGIPQQKPGAPGQNVTVVSPSGAYYNAAASDDYMESF